MKKLLTCILILLIIGSCSVTYADDEIEELDDIDLQNIIETSVKCEDELAINARTYVVYDRESGRVVLGKNENKKNAMASTTKIMTAIVVIENASLEDIVEISRRAASTGGSRLGLKMGNKVSVKDLLYGLMLRSGNDSAVALAEYVAGSVENFAELMNNKARSLNLMSTHFVTPHGLDNPNHYTTAYELAKITDYALKNDVFSKIVATKSYTISIDGNSKNINNTNELLGNFKGVYGVKTGFTNNAGRCLVTATKNEKFDIITVVLQADTKKDRTNDSIKLINYVFKNYTKVDIYSMISERYDEWIKVNINRIHIKKARDTHITLQKTESKYKEIIVKSSNVKDINIFINAIFEYEAPVYNKTKIGEIQVFVEGNLIESIDILADKSILAKDYKDYLYNCLEIISNLL